MVGIHGDSYTFETSNASLAWLGESIVRRHSGGCLSPVGVKYRVPAYQANTLWNGTHFVHKSWEREKPLSPKFGQELHMYRCRKCPVCTSAARYEWIRRAEAEHRTAKRTLWGTLTFSDNWLARRWQQYDFEQQSKALKHPERNDASGVRFAMFQAHSGSRSDFVEQDRARELQFLGEELTLFFKRLRKRGLTFRYMAATEFGAEKGRAHFHFVMHLQEDVPFAMVRKELKANWEHGDDCKCRKNRRGQFVENCRVGWADVKLASTPEDCHYAAKYVGKHSGGGGAKDLARYRVRASIKYGRINEGSKEFDENSFLSLKETLSDHSDLPQAAPLSPQRSEDDHARSPQGEERLGVGLTVTALSDHAHAHAGEPVNSVEGESGCGQILRSRDRGSGGAGYKVRPPPITH